MDTYTTHDQFDGTKLTGTKPKYTSFGQINYFEIPLFYNYGTEEKPVVTGCYVEYPIIDATGIQLKEHDSKNKKGEAYIKKSYSIILRPSLQDPEVSECMQKVDELYMSCAKIVEANKVDVKMPHFEASCPEKSEFQSPAYYATDEFTGERVTGRNPTQWVSLNNWSSNKSLFTDMEGNPIDWSLLTDVEMKIVPLIHFKDVFLGSKKKIRASLVSAIVTEIHPINSVSRQMSTIDRLKAKNKDLTDQVASQLAQLRMDRQDQLENEREESIPVASVGSTESSSNTGSMHRIPQQTHSNDPETQNMQDYLGAAPSMNQSVPPPQHQQPQHQQSFSQGYQPQPSSQAGQVQQVSAQTGQQYYQPASTHTQPQNSGVHLNVQPPSHQQPPQQVQASAIQFN